MKLIGSIVIQLCFPFIVFAVESPTWVQDLPKAPGKVYGIGLGAITDSESKAIEIATQSARFEVLAQLKSRVEGDTATRSSITVNRSTGSATTASSHQNVSVSSRTSIDVESLPGLVVAARYIDTGSHTAYVLAYLDINIVEVAVTNEISDVRSELKSLESDRNDNVLSVLQALQKMHQRVVKADNLVSILTPVSGNSKLREDVQVFKINIVQRLKDMKRQVTVGLLPGAPIANDLKSILRESVNAKGLIWSNHNPTIVLDVHVNSGSQAIDISRKAWSKANQTTDLISIRTSITCSLCDTYGNTYGSFEVNAIGVGDDEFTAKRAMIKDIRNKFPIKLQEAIDSQLQI